MKKTNGLPLAVTQGFKDAYNYDLYRPSYPTEAVEAFLKRLKVLERPGARIVEIGAGTGKFTEVLSRRPEGFRITAVEPLAEMRGTMVAKALPNVTVIEGSAAEIPLEDSCGDACVVAQAFHW
jgi:16S rRNA A1518/A1519 N6-dimethyltransferase RsmA/KsgA/DIM1 with predicted DNA glycosylase/AP lyase activity